MPENGTFVVAGCMTKQQNEANSHKDCGDKDVDIVLTGFIDFMIVEVNTIKSLSKVWHITLSCHVSYKFTLKINHYEIHCFMFLIYYIVPGQSRYY